MPEVEAEKRDRLPAVPDNLRGLLTEHQLMSIRRLEGFGWELKFVRRHGIPEPIPAIIDPNGNSLGVLDADGRLNLKHDMRLRN